jgi:uncharacterized protein (DUF1501 family)/uncharacterized protein (DUF1800 family)
MYDELDNAGKASTNKILLGVVAVLVSIAILLAIVLGATLGGSSYNPYELTPCTNGTLQRLADLSVQRPNGDTVYRARCYDGNGWEPVADQDFPPVVIECVDDVCQVLTKGSYEVHDVNVPDYLIGLSDTELIARLLSQATWGVNKADLEAAVASVSTKRSTQALDLEGWIQNQVDQTPTLHRSHFRQRANPRQEAALNIGSIFGPCEVGSRWYRYAFNIFDEGQTLVVAANEITGVFTLRVAGVLRAEIPKFLNTTWSAGLPTQNFTLCTVVEGVDRNSTITAFGVGCSTADQKDFGMDFPNPAITFSATNPTIPQATGFVALPWNPDVLIMTASPAGCSLLAPHAWVNVSGDVYRYDPRLKLLTNSLDTPANVSSEGSLVCPTVVPTFLNERTCIKSSSCAPLTFTNALMTLNVTNLRSWYTTSNRYVYYLQDFRLDEPYNESPCKPGTSRWKRLGAGACPSATALDANTLATLQAALAGSSDTNPYVRDISVVGTNCTENTLSIGAQVFAAGECFQHVHPDLYSVRDMSEWVILHDGNDEALAAGMPNPIAKWAENGLVNLNFPSNHPMSRFKDRVKYFPLVGRFGDVVDFASLPTVLQTLEMALIVGAADTRSSEGFQACGSPGELANDPMLGNRYYLANPNDNTQARRELDWQHDLTDGKSMVWINVILKAPDQLRQRVAWALSQILTMSQVGLGREDEIEPWVSYYDIFVRNAFGNYRDILREVSYHPMMSFYLSYYRNRGFAFAKTYPDENYAREIMQLFTIGLWKLNDDGSQILDSKGNPIPSYTNDDIIDFARVWTGFDLQQPRSNIEEEAGSRSPNVIDPSLLQPAWRDKLPKAKLASGFLGDHYPLCESLPAQSFLTEGATWTFTGAKSDEGAFLDAENITDVGLRGRFTIQPTSALFSLLCAPGTDGACTFPPKVVLTQNLACTGVECSVGRVISAKIIDPVTAAVKYYTYTSVPCVRLTFFDSGKLTSYSGSTTRQCANQKNQIASPTCCEAAAGRQNRVISSNFETGFCNFANEAVDWVTAGSRCSAAGYAMCNLNYTGGANWNRTCAAGVFQWLNEDCQVQVQVFETGQIAVVDPSVHPTSSLYTVLRNSSNNLFRVRWVDEFPAFDNKKCPIGCRPETSTLGETCICQIRVNDSAVFVGSSVPSRDEILENLFIGAPKPSSFPAGVYTAGTPEGGVTVWTKNGAVFDMDTIFQIDAIRAGGAPLFLLNMVSNVLICDNAQLSGCVESDSFRNPPHFLPLTGELTNIYQEWTSESIRLATHEQEIESLLEHLFEHNNTAPFVSYRLIQRMVTSNPSPRYMKSVVAAFRTGTYAGRTFSGKYGDLEATINAILLDEEARSTILEADPTHGLLREPIVKVMHLLRAMEYQSIDGREVMMPYLNRIGMEAFNAPSVFGFYLPEHRPDGPVTDAGLVAPEAQLSTSPIMIAYLNSFTSLMDYGLTFCGSGFGYNYLRNCRTPETNVDGNISYVQSATATAAEVIQELDLLLTGGRLHPFLRDYITQQYEASMASTNSLQDSLNLAQKLITFSPEFHASSANILTDVTRQEAEETESKGRKYKAIVVIFQAGGADTFNALVPHSDCRDKDLHEEYTTVRAGAALAKSELLPITVPGGTQPCNTFGLHNSMPTLKALYDDKDSLWIANMGALVEPLTKLDYEKKSGIIKKFPPSLFAHNIMTRSMHNLHPQNAAAKGVLGRAVQALKEQDGYKSNMYSLVGSIKILEGEQAPDFIDPWSGVTQFSQYNQLRDAIGNMTANKSQNAFSETYSSLFRSALERTEALGKIIKNTSLVTAFGTDSMSRQFEQVAKLIKIRDQLNTERAVFVTQRGGYDTHGTFDLSKLFGDIDTGMSSFVEEMKAQGIWDDVVVMTVSEFGRTLTSNGGGTDHAWGGNYFVAGGKVKGGRVLGAYPDTLNSDGDLNIGRGRVLPTTSWEAVWKGVLQWFGVSDGKMSEVLPNAGNFPGGQLFSQGDMFN